MDNTVPVKAVFKFLGKLSMVVQPLILAVSKQRQVDLYEFRASLVYRVRFSLKTKHTKPQRWWKSDLCSREGLCPACLSLAHLTLLDR